MRVLIIYPHGLGDCILCTPAIRHLKKAGHFIGFAMLERFKTSQLFNNNPNINNLYYTKDAWNDYPSFAIGCKEIMKSMQPIAQHYDRTIFIKHSTDKSKIIDCAKLLFDDSLDDVHTEIYTNNIDCQKARDYVFSKIKEKRFGFIHSKTGVARKDLPDGYGQQWLKENVNCDVCVEVGKDFKYDDFNINTQFEIMRLSSAVCLSDSVFFHACCAMDKIVDLVYFARGESIYNRVKPLHNIKHNVIYKL